MTEPSHGLARVLSSQGFDPDNCKFVVWYFKSKLKFTFIFKIIRLMKGRVRIYSNRLWSDEMSSDLLIYAVQILTFCFLLDPYKQYYILLKSSHWSDPLTEAFDHQISTKIALTSHCCDQSLIPLIDSGCMRQGMVVARLYTWVFSGHSSFLPHHWPPRSITFVPTRYIFIEVVELVYM